MKLIENVPKRIMLSKETILKLPYNAYTQVIKYAFTILFTSLYRLYYHYKMRPFPTRNSVYKYS